jgi:hypothetical protein
MVSQGALAEKTTAILTKDFTNIRAKGREINLENNPDVNFLEIAPDEVAIFCRLTSSIVSLAYTLNKEQFDFQKQIMDILLIVPKNSQHSETNSNSTRYVTRSFGPQTKKKRYSRKSKDFWWRCFD